MVEPSEKAWHKLDNAAKIFPSTSGRADTRVFRFSCELHEKIDENLLQHALEQTLDAFPGFRYVLKRGLFWYYLEQSSIKPVVQKENDPPCSMIFNRKTLLFEVTWYGKRINVEVYHVLTDGTGAMQFLKTLVLYYLKLKHPEGNINEASIDYDASETQKMSDAFEKYYDNSKEIQKVKKPTAYHIKYAKESEWRLKIIEGTVSTKAILSKAHEYNATVTAFVTALFMKAIYGEMNVRDRKKPIVISIPVNLRNYFDSKSAFNFFSIIDIKYNFNNNSDSLDEIIDSIKGCFAERLSEEYLQSRLNRLYKLERNFLIRLVPLPIKNFFMSTAYEISMRDITASVSNLGKIQMPDEVKPYIRLFDIFTGTKKLQICMCSYEDKMNISFSSPFINTDIQCSFFRLLSEMGIETEITANKLKK